MKTPFPVNVSVLSIVCCNCERSDDACERSHDALPVTVSVSVVPIQFMIVADCRLLLIHLMMSLRA